VDGDPVERARRRLAAIQAGRPDEADLHAALERARAQVEELGQTAAELESSLPERLGAALRDGLAAEVSPVARQLAELRGLTTQAIRRLERLEGAVEAERRARVEDLALLVDLVASGWRAVEHRLDRLERIADRLERSLEPRQGPPSLLRLDDRRSEPAS